MSRNNAPGFIPDRCFKGCCWFLLFRPVVSCDFMAVIELVINLTVILFTLDIRLCPQSPSSMLTWPSLSVLESSVCFCFSWTSHGLSVISVWVQAGSSGILLCFCRFFFLKTGDQGWFWHGNFRQSYTNMWLWLWRLVATSWWAVALSYFICGFFQYLLLICTMYSLLTSVCSFMITIFKYLKVTARSPQGLRV